MYSSIKTFFFTQLKNPLTLLKLFKHDVQGDILEHKVARVLVVLAESAQRRVVVGVHEGQVLDEQHRHYVGAAALVNRDTGVTFE